MMVNKREDIFFFVCGAYRLVGETKIVQVNKCENGNFSESNEENSDRGDGLLGYKGQGRLL